MTYQEYHATYTTKAKGYPLNACVVALSDCHQTLKLWGDDISAEYSKRLWAEVDAMRERISYLQSKQA